MVVVVENSGLWSAILYSTFDVRGCAKWLWGSRSRIPVYGSIIHWFVESLPDYQN